MTFVVVGLVLVASAALVGVSFSVLMLLHNEDVYRCRGKVIDYCHAASVAAIGAGGDSDWSLIERVSYDEMMRKWWRRPESFFPEVFPPGKVRE